MYFKLTNGESVNLRSNVEAAKFVYLVMPFKNLKFEGDNKPKIVITGPVLKIIRLYDKLVERAKAHDRAIERMTRIMTQEFDDDIPF